LRLSSVWSAIGVCAVVVLTAETAPGATVEDVPIVGGAAAFAQALGISPPPDRPRFVGELTRLLYNIPEGKNVELDAKVQRLTAYLELVRSFQASLAAAARRDGSIALEMARQKGDRDRLKGFLETIGLRLREKNRNYSVDRTGNKEAAERVRLLKTLGVELDTLQARLNRGESVTIQIPAESVPIPLTPKLWSVMVFQREIAPRDLVAAILSDRNAALLCRGLAGLDDETIEFLEAHPAMVTRLYEHDAAVFGVFGDSLRIRNGVVVPPGGMPAVALWEGLFGEKVNRPERFVRELFSDSQGRSAYLYSTLDHLDRTRRAFAMGLAIKDTGIRLERFKALSDIAKNAYGDWQVKVSPFKRAPHDLSMLLSRVRVNADASLIEPRATVFWSRAFESRDLPDDAARRLRNVHEDGDIDAAWLAAQVVSGDGAERQLRFEQFTFGQRAFGGADERALPDALVGVRAYPKYGMLMLALERVGARTPAVFAAAARHADRLASLDPNHAFVALSQFQGAVALLTRLVRAGSLEPARAESLVTGLAAISLNEDGWYQRGIAKWMRGPLAEALALPSDGFDGRLEAVLSGRTFEGPARSIMWEGHRYKVDFAAAERRRLRLIHEKTARLSLDDVFALDSMAERLTKATAVTDIQETLARLKAFPVPATPAKQMVMPPGVDPPKAPREVITRATNDLSKITKPKDVKKATSVSESLGRLVDVLLAESIRSLVYALDLGDPDTTVISGIDASARHDFGFALQISRDARSLVPWVEPRRAIVAGTPWHVQGSLLNLDLALAPMALRQVSKPAAGRLPVLTDNERDAYAGTAALLNAFALHDSERDAIAEAIDRGHRRLEQLFERWSPEATDILREDAAVDGWRRRAVQWSMTHQLDPFSFLSLAELLQLGGPPTEAVLAPWGASARRADGCICTKLDQPLQWFQVVGRPQLGVLATQMPDLNLRVAVLLHELGLPAGLARDVLLAATQDFIDETAPTDPDDWLTLVRSAQALKRERVEDYVGALAASGPLSLDEGTRGETRR